MSSAKVRALQEPRKARGMSVGELGRRTGLAEAAIQRWEGGDEEPDAAALGQRASAFGMLRDAPWHDEDPRHQGATSEV